MRVRFSLLLLLALAGLSTGGAAAFELYAGKQIELVVGSGPGGATTPMGGCWHATCRATCRAIRQSWCRTCRAPGGFAPPTTSTTSPPRTAP